MKRFLALAIWAAVACRLVAAEQTNRYQRVANELKALLNKGDYAAIHKMFAAEMTAALPSDKASSFFDGLMAQYGKLEGFGEMRREGQWMVFPAHFQRGLLDLKLALDPADKVSGLLLSPPQPQTQAPQRNATKLSLPFKGQWLVFRGGDTREVNYHHDTPNQKFALDLIGVGEDGKTRRGQTNRNEDYFAMSSRYWPISNKALSE
jgi:hypothetical protein